MSIDRSKHEATVKAKVLGGEALGLPGDLAGMVGKMLDGVHQHTYAAFPENLYIMFLLQYLRCDAPQMCLQVRFQSIE